MKIYNVLNLTVTIVTITFCSDLKCLKDINATE